MKKTSLKKIKNRKQYKFKDFDNTLTLNNCFLEGTLVATKDGLYPIEKITPGTLVYTYSYFNHTLELKPVVQLIKNWTDEYFIITDDNDAKMFVTSRHLIRLYEPNRWEWSSDLDVGNKLQTLDGFVTIKHIIENRKVNKIEMVLDKKGNILEMVERDEGITTDKTYNLQIEDNYNYFVGESKILVHNSKRISIFSSTIQEYTSIYKIFESASGNDYTEYVGKTNRPLDQRFEEHIKDKKKGFSKATHGQKAIFSKKMTPYEVAVNEKYYLEKFKQEALVNSKRFLNKQNPISKKKFDDFKQLHNPC